MKMVTNNQIWDTLEVSESNQGISGNFRAAGQSSCVLVPLTDMKGKTVEEAHFGNQEPHFAQFHTEAPQ